MSKAAAVTTANFQSEVLESTIPVLVDFWAPWCPPCRAIGPELDAVAESMVGQAKILKLDVDEEPEVEARYGVKTIPTLIIFKNGEPVGTIHGAVSRTVIANKLREYV
jgi:thioredoxin 1